MSIRKMLTNYNMDPLNGTPATNDNELYGHVLGHSPNLGVSSICGPDSYDSWGGCTDMSGSVPIEPSRDPDWP